MPTLVVYNDVAKPLKSTFRTNKDRNALALRISDRSNPLGRACLSDHLVTAGLYEHDSPEQNIHTASAMNQLRDDMVDFGCGVYQGAPTGQ